MKLSIYYLSMRTLNSCWSYFAKWSEKAPFRWERWTWPSRIHLVSPTRDTRRPGCDARAETGPGFSPPQRSETSPPLCLARREHIKAVVKLLGRINALDHVVAVAQEHGIKDIKTLLESKWEGARSEDRKGLERVLCTCIYCEYCTCLKWVKASGSVPNTILAEDRTGAPFEFDVRPNRAVEKCVDRRATAWRDERSWESGSRCRARAFPEPIFRRAGRLVFICSLSPENWMASWAMSNEKWVAFPVPE